MNRALESPGLTSAFTAWTVQPLVIVAVVLLAAWYARGVRRLEATTRARWSRGRATTFGFGLVLLLWAGTGFWQVYAHSLYWVWTSQTLMLWLLIPIVLLWGHPLQLARALGRDGRIARMLRSRPARIVSNPLIGPALVPILSFALFFGPLPGWAITTGAVGWPLHLVLVLVGGLMVLPLVGLDDDVSSLAVGLSLAIGSFELVIDALPGIVLRLHTHLATSWFDYQDVYGWSPRPLHDQQFAGGILWTLAEIIDLPFLWLVYRRWLRADARDAARVDAVLEAERVARRGLTHDPEAPPTGVAREDGDDGRTDRDIPWWVGDPAMERRLRRLD